jgi:hypothetical protein
MVGRLSSYRAGHSGKEGARFPSECSSSGYLIRLLFTLGSDFGAFMNLRKSKINPLYPKFALT